MFIDEQTQNTLNKADFYKKGWYLWKCSRLAEAEIAAVSKGWTLVQKYGWAALEKTTSAYPSSGETLLLFY